MLGNYSKSWKEKGKRDDEEKGREREIKKFFNNH